MRVNGDFGESHNVGSPTATPAGSSNLLSWKAAFVGLRGS